MWAMVIALKDAAAQWLHPKTDNKWKVVEMVVLEQM